MNVVTRTDPLLCPDSIDWLNAFFQSNAFPNFRMESPLSESSVSGHSPSAPSSPGTANNNGTPAGALSASSSSSSTAASSLSFSASSPVSVSLSSEPSNYNGSSSDFSSTPFFSGSSSDSGSRPTCDKFADKASSIANPSAKNQNLENKRDGMWKKTAYCSMVREKSVESGVIMQNNLRQKCTGIVM